MVTYERYKGNNIIVLSKTENDRYPFSFGFGKAKLIVDHIDAIKAFVDGEMAYQAKEQPDDERK